MKAIRLGCIGVLVWMSQAVAFAQTDIDFIGNALLRYENDTQLTGKPDRERLRLIARAGLKFTLSPAWSAQVRLSTGLRNKQNVPAITLYKFTEQPQPDSNIYIEQAFVNYIHNGLALRAGKQPWPLNNVTDIFWDRHLNPVGVSAQWTLSDTISSRAMWVAPLDGASATVGSMAAVQMVWQGMSGDLTWMIAPWLVEYQGDSHCEFACNDTRFDHQSARVSTWIKRGNWRLGSDIGYALSMDDVDDEFKQERMSFAAELRYGDVKKAGNYEAYIRWLHVERYAVISEFAQNATSTLANSNIEGIDIRARYALSPVWWLGLRMSQIDNIAGNEISSHRVRLETQYNW